jgi:hypothetical protein
MSTHVIDIQIGSAGALALVSSAGSWLPTESLQADQPHTRVTNFPGFARLGRSQIPGAGARAPDIAPSKHRG